MTIEQRASRMLEAWMPSNLLQSPCQYAKSACGIFDITEDDPIPRGEIVSLEDFDSSGCLFVVSWNNKIYLADPSELIPHYG